MGCGSGRRVRSRASDQKTEEGLLGTGPRDPSADFDGERCSRDTDESTTDQAALLFQKSQGVAAKPARPGRLLMAHRQRL